MATRSSQPRKSTAQKARSKSGIEKSAGAVVFHRGSELQYLLIFSTYWEFPKGMIDPDEGEAEAATREVREETGLEVELQAGFRHEINYFYRRRNTGQLIKKQVVYFLAQAKRQDIKLSWEHRESVWLTYEDALSRLKYENARQVLQRAHEFLYRVA